VHFVGPIMLIPLKCLHPLPNTRIEQPQKTTVLLATGGEQQYKIYYESAGVLFLPCYGVVCFSVAGHKRLKKDSNLSTVTRIAQKVSYWYCLILTLLQNCGCLSHC
jgi:hypothetical protein